MEDRTDFKGMQHGFYMIEILFIYTTGFITLPAEGLDLFPTDPTVDRYELYYYEGNPYSALLNRLCVAFSKRLDNKTKIVPLDYENAYIVTKYGDYPSFLVETGFASNESAAQKLNSPAWRAEFCKALAEEIIKAVK